MHPRPAGRTLRCGRPVCLVLAPLLVLVVMLAAGCTVVGSDEKDGDARRGARTGSAVFRAPSGVLLARPVAEGREARNSTFRVLTRLIRHTPAGETIRITGNSFSFVPVAEELVAAHDRGVRVQVIIDDVSRGWRAPAVLGEALGTDPGAGSFLHMTAGQVHQKVWSFTRTGASRDVVLMGSMNLTYQSARQYTDVHSYVGRRDVRRGLDRRFVQLRRHLPDVPPLDPVRVGRDRMWFYPGYTHTNDPVRAMLDAVPADGARIRVVMYAWLDERGLELAELLAAKDAAGADVEVVLGASTGDRIRVVLADSGVEVHPGVFADGDDVHHKLTLVSYPGADGRARRFVLTGSDNYTSRSLDRPEVLLRIEADRGPTFRRYDRWVDALVARGVREAR